MTSTPRIAEAPSTTTIAPLATAGESVGDEVAVARPAGLAELDEVVIAPEVFIIAFENTPISDLVQNCPRMTLEDALPTYLRSLETVRDEHDTPLRVAEGALPPALRGVLYRNGPGKMEVFGARYGHPFDGDGMVTRFSFDSGAVHYRNRFVRTAEFVAEERAGRMLYRSFGTNLPGGLRRNALRLRFKNAANTSVVVHGGKLLALWEGGLPHALDPETLETRGRYDFAGKLQNHTSLIGQLLAPELPFSAHPKRDVDTGDLFNFGTLLGKESQLVLYRVRPDGTMDRPSFIPLAALSFVHDFVLTKRYAVFFLSSVSFRVAATLLGLATPVGSLRPSDQPASILLVPRDGGRAITVPAASGFLFHFVNGFDDDEGRVVLDGMRMGSLLPAAGFQAILEGRPVEAPAPAPTRYVVDVGRLSVTEAPLADTPAELPTINPRRAGRPYRHFWALAGEKGQTDPFFRQLLHADGRGGETVRDFAPDLPGEPLFVPVGDPANESEGFVLCLVYRAADHRSDLYVLDPDDLRTVCRLELPHHVPPGFHGTWVAG